MLRILPLLLAACFAAPLPAQITGDSLYFLRPTDTLTLYHDPASGFLIHEHFLAPGQTLYGTGRFYGLTETDIYHLSPKLRAGYKVGDLLRVPVPPKMLRAVPAADSMAWFVPVRYRVGNGETLWGLTHRRMTHLSQQQVMAMNPGLTADNLHRGKVIAVGYLKLDGIPPGAQGEIEDPYVRRNRGLRELWKVRSAGKSVRAGNGKAAWTRKGAPDKFMALHRTAPLNSLIEIDDPRSRKTLYARVVGRVPESVYPPDVIVVVSPLLVKAFGVRDQQFYVRTRHF